MKINQLIRKFVNAGFQEVEFTEQKGEVTLARRNNVVVYAQRKFEHDHAEEDIVSHVSIDVLTQNISFRVSSPVSLIQQLINLGSLFSRSEVMLRYLCNAYMPYVNEYSGKTDFDVRYIAVLETFSRTDGLRYFVLEGMLYENGRFHSYVFPVEYNALRDALNYVRDRFEFFYTR